MWLPVRGYEGSYEVSDDGRIRSVDRLIIPSSGPSYIMPGIELVRRRQRRGYLRVALSRHSVVKYFLVHRLVAEAFVPPFFGDQVNHRNFAKQENMANNLEWVTNAENVAHAVRGGRYAK
jgi:NUMOD4 motif/HNH endonuclease